MERDLLKAKENELYQEMAQNDTVQAIKQSNVLVTNSKHIVIAIFYGDGFIKLPVVTAKGTDVTAETID